VKAYGWEKYFICWKLITLTNYDRSTLSAAFLEIPQPRTVTTSIVLIRNFEKLNRRKLILDKWFNSKQPTEVESIANSELFWTIMNYFGAAARQNDRNAAPFAKLYRLALILPTSEKTFYEFDWPTRPYIHTGPLWLGTTVFSASSRCTKLSMYMKAFSLKQRLQGLATKFIREH
jgi:hypothetical protein